MRIVHVANFHGQESGGFATTMRHLGAGYRRAGHDFFLIVPGTQSSRQQTPYGTVITIATLPGRLRTTSLIPVEVTVRRILSDLEPGRLEVSDRLTLRRLGTWAKRHSVPAILVVHNRPSDWLMRPSAAAVGTPTGHINRERTSTRGALRDFSSVVCTTAATRDRYEHILPGQVGVVPLGVDLETFSPHRWSADARRAYLKENTVLIVHAGRFTADKSPVRVIDTLRELRRRGVDARLVMAGAGPLRARLERAARDLPVDFVGQIDEPRDLATLLACADVVVSAGPRNTFSVSWLEALASGSPVVASAGSAAGELLSHSAGELAGDSGLEFADAVVRILDRRIADRRADAREVAAGYPWSRTVDLMLAAHWLTPTTSVVRTSRITA
ncbi:MAG: glycosyltransferase [Glaciihabitans sp.]|nr:glycosyltransferase [Glaciihabitans sp.]